MVSQDEIGRLAGNFNAMTMELAASRRRMERLTEGLERQVAAKTAEVRRTEGLLAQAERLAALGRLTAEIAHEIRNPLTALGGYARRLLRTVSSDTEKEYARIVVGGGDAAREPAQGRPRLLAPGALRPAPAVARADPAGIAGGVRGALRRARHPGRGGAGGRRSRCSSTPATCAGRWTT